MVVVGYYHLFTHRQVSNKAEESKMVTRWYVIRFFAIALNDSGYCGLLPFCHSDERFLRGLPISRPNREESEIAQAS